MFWRHSQDATIWMTESAVRFRWYNLRYICSTWYLVLRQKLRARKKGDKSQWQSENKAGIVVSTCLARNYDRHRDRLCPLTFIVVYLRASSTYESGHWCARIYPSKLPIGIFGDLHTAFIGSNLILYQSEMLLCLLHRGRTLKNSCTSTSSCHLIPWICASTVALPTSPL